MMGGFTLQVRNPDSWEGWYWGAKHVWGQGFQGMMAPAAEPHQGHLRALRHGPQVGLRRRDHALGLHRAVRHPHLATSGREAGIKQVYICPDLNFGAAVHADKWIPILPNTDAALQLAIIYVWLTEDTWDKEYVATHAVGMDKVADYVLGKEDGIPKTPEWASAEVRRARVDHQGAGARVRQEDAPRSSTTSAAPSSAARTRTSPAGWSASCSACRASAGPACTSAR